MNTSINYDGFTGVLEKSSALVTPMAEKTTARKINTNPTPTILEMKAPDTKKVENISFVSWGADNKKPIEIINEIDAVPSASRALVKRVESTYGMGPFLYKVEID